MKDKIKELEKVLENPDSINKIINFALQLEDFKNITKYLTTEEFLKLYELFYTSELIKNNSL